MAEKTITLGQAIDNIIAALNGLEADARRTALEAACSHLGVKLGASSGTPLPTILPSSTLTPSLHAAPPSHGSGQRPPDIRALKESKKPASAKEMACVVAYYLQELAPEADRKNAISTEDLEKFFKQAGFPLPRKMEQVLVDAKRSGYFDSSSRGQYALNAVGYNLAAHNLPKTKAD